MKQTILYTLCGIFLLASCQQEEAPSGDGYLSVAGIELRTQTVTEVSSRAVDESLIVDLYKGGQFQRTLTAEEMQNKIELDAAADYSLKVHSANYGEDDSWTNEQKGEPIYYKEQSFEVKAGETTAVTVKVPMANYAVQLSLPEELTWVSSYTFTVTSGERAVVLQKGETAYFPYTAGGSFSYELKLTNTDEEPFTLSGTWGKEEEGESLAFNTCYVVTYQVATQSLAVIH